MSETAISVDDSKVLLALFGPRDCHLRRIRESLGISISIRDHTIHIIGDDQAVARATNVVETLTGVLQKTGFLGEEEVTQALAIAQGQAPIPVSLSRIEVMQAARAVRPRTPGQTRYVQAIQQNDLVFCAGPAGSGKTYLAVAMAVSALKQATMRKIVLVRPAVEAGESLGFLPGDLQAKINPYLRPLLDALREMMDYDQMKRYMEQDVIEVIPLAYMRGRTLNESFIILDEAQNTTVAQMKMFLTRMGRGSKIVVSGDTTQIDLPSRLTSGLIDAGRRLVGIKGVVHVALSNADIVRHQLVQDIVSAYEDKPRKRR
jgi:phosphate starvation-inducible PhoH-like protein